MKYNCQKIKDTCDVMVCVQYIVRFSGESNSYRSFKVIMRVNNISNNCHVIQKYLISSVGKMTAVFGILVFSQYYLILLILILAWFVANVHDSWKC